MQCDRCDSEAVVDVPYSGTHLCDRHLRRSVEKRVRRRIREDGLVGSDVTPDEPETWAIGLSGGKDSAVLTHILHRTFRTDPRVRLVAITIHEGIEGYRDESVAACIELAEDRDLEHELVAYESEYGIRMDAVAASDREMATCAYCGVFRRDALERTAREIGADKLLTGHNLDDEAQTAMMNFLSGDLDQMAKHFEASLGAFPDRQPQSQFVPRAKPLRDIPEREVALYAHLADVPAHITECPHAGEAYRGEIQGLIHGLEQNHPGTRHSIMAGYERIAAVLADRRNSSAPDLDPCTRCGEPSPDDVCRKCELLDRLTVAD